MVTIAIEGVVDSVSDPYGFLGGDIGIGDVITGAYTYDLATPESNPLPEVGDYEHRSAPSGIRLTVGGYEFRTDPPDVYFLYETADNNQGLDGLLLRSYNNLSLANGIAIRDISWMLLDDTEGALSSASLPTTAPALQDWGTNHLNIGAGEERGPGFSITGHVTSAVVVPEPATIVILGAGSLFLHRRRRQR